MGGLLRLVDRAEGDGRVVDLALEGAGSRRTATVPVGFDLTGRDRDDVRWYLEDYLQYPVDPAPDIAQGVEARLAELGEDLFRQVFDGSRDAARIWDTVVADLAGTRVEVATGVEGAAGIPWELLRDPATGGWVSVRAGAFVRTLAETSTEVPVPEAAGRLRLLLIICRPGGRVDVPFRSVASHLVRLSREARQVLELEVLRPPTYARLGQVLQAARDRGEPFHVVHFDGHGAWLDRADLKAAADGGVAAFDRDRFSVLSPARSGSHGYLVFEDPATKDNQQLVDGPALGQLLADAGVPVLVLNACRSAHAGLATAPERDTAAELDAHRRVRAYGSLAQEVMDAGVAGVVAMAYNVYVVTAAQFIGNVYTALLEGRQLGQAVTTARRQLAANPLRQISLQPRPLQDWLVPVVYEAAPLTLHATPHTEEGLSVSLSQAEAGKERASLDPAVLAGPDVGFYGRDETLLALDRAFDTNRIVLLHAWAGGGKTTTATEFARWYAITGAAGDVLFSSFTRHLPLARLLDQIGDHYGPALSHAGVDWATLTDAQRRDIALQVLAQLPVLWIWDNVEPVTGFPAGAESAWTQQEQDELAQFLRDLAHTETGCKVLLTSRRDEQPWLGDLPARVRLPAMPMLERLELAKAVASRQAGAQRFLDVQDWRLLLEFTAGNPLTVTVLARQAIRDRYTTREQIQGFVDRLRTGAATITDDETQGRAGSLAASLDYGFTHAFTDPERAILALLALFQGFVYVGALQYMGDPAYEMEPVPAVAELTREQGIALLDRAAETGLLTRQGDGYYAVHPAIPWHLRRLFDHHYGPWDDPTARHAVHAWTAAISILGEYWHRLYNEGHTNVIGVLEGDEDNLLRARQLARQNGWWNLAIGPMQGLLALYQHTGRTVEWRRLVNELVPDLTDPTGGPLAGREEQWALLTGYRAGIARDTRDWPAAQRLQDARITWHRQHAAGLLTQSPETLDAGQRNTIRNLGVAIEDLGHIVREQGQPACVDHYLEAMGLFQRISHTRGEAVVAFNLGHAYKDVPGLRDLDQAEHWYKRYLELLEPHDTLRRGRGVGQLANVAHRRFYAAQEAGADDEQLLQHLNDAAAGWHEELNLVPADAINERAVAHHSLGNVYRNAGDTVSALEHYQQAIQLRERQDDRYDAGWARHDTALALSLAGRNRDALLYARAALRDFEAVGPGAAGFADSTRQLITMLQREPPDQP